MNKLLALGVVLSAVSACTPRLFNGSDSSAIERDQAGNIQFVDTHDGYAHTTEVNKSTFGRYFQRVDGKKAVVITSDCAWVDAANGKDLLDAVKRNNIKVTFFISGPFLFSNPSKGSAGGLEEENLPLIRRMIEEGHEFGNHSTTHPHNGDGPDWHWELTDLAKGWSMVLQRLYGNNPPANATLKNFWRAPFGEYDTTSLRAASRAGFPYHFGWNVDVRDTTSLPDCRSSRSANCLDPGKLTDYVLKFAEKNDYNLDAIVILSHLSNYYFWGKDPNGIDRMATQLRSNGYEFARLSQTFRFPSTGGGEVVVRATPRPVGAIECPADFILKDVGQEGGRYCIDSTGKNILGPYTETMKEKCRQWGGGPACNNDVWAAELALSARGTELCPQGASFDNQTGYCTEGENAFGPFPKPLVAKCMRAGGGDPCKSARWSRRFLGSLLEQ